MVDIYYNALLIYSFQEIDKNAVECGKDMQETGLEFVNVDYVTAGRLIASNVSQEEIDRERLSQIVPRRRKRETKK